MSELPECPMKVCHPDAEISGMIPMFGKAENSWPSELRTVLYLLGLLWTFMGVAIIADVFMGAIERITSKKKRKLNPDTKKLVTVHVWNATVANLTLMALGSSAPEILLSCIELLTGRFYAGDLGPSTIVGSAAFNLFCIAAVCVAAIPEGEIRAIDDLSVYAITAGFSLFAYFWLLVILQFTSPNVVTIAEGVITFLFFPLLVILAFLADKGYLFRKEKPPTQVLSVDMSPEELAQCMTRIRQQHGAALSDEQVMKLLQVEYGEKPTKAQYRIIATRNALGNGKKVHMKESDRRSCVTDYKDFTSDDKILVKQETATHVGFSMPRFAVLESVGVAQLSVTRTGNLKRPVSVEYQTIDGSAKAGDDYISKQGVLEFAPNETEKFVEVEVMDDNSHEEDEEFFVTLSNLVDNGEGPKGTCELFNEKTTVVIIDDDDPGILKFEAEQRELYENIENTKLVLTVHRVNGSTGKVGCKYTTEDGTAIRGADYMHAQGTLEFDNQVMSQQIEIEVISRGRYERDEEFRVMISEAFGGASFDESTDGAKDSCICTIVVKPNGDTKEGTTRMMDALKVNWDKSQLGHANYASQFKDAIALNSGDEDDEGGGSPGPLGYFLHAITVPWKLLFALIPPVDYADGWLCFCCSLTMIGGVTYMVGSLATFLGCCMGIADEITAITFVALGTSLPDTFASKTAAVMDEYADASIGNVTGSNSVNVFLGLGLPWMIGAIYWVAVGPNEEWVERYPEQFLEYPNGIFVVPGGSLGFNVLVFTLLACVAMLFLFLRRLSVGGELGGPNAHKYASAAFLTTLWFIYIALSIWKIVSEPRCTVLV